MVIYTFGGSHLADGFLWQAPVFPLKVSKQRISKDDHAFNAVDLIGSTPPPLFINEKAILYLPNGER